MMCVNNNGNGVEGEEESQGSSKSNPIGNFEEAFINCLTSLSKDDLANSDMDEVRFDLEKSISDLLSKAHESEKYFIKKRLQIESEKPELIVRDETHELRYELMRKEELIRKNFDKISAWQSTLSDIQQQQNAMEIQSAGDGVPESPSILSTLVSTSGPSPSPAGGASSSSFQGYSQLLQKLTSQPLISSQGKSFESNKQ